MGEDPRAFGGKVGTWLSSAHGGTAAGRTRRGRRRSKRLPGGLLVLAALAGLGLCAPRAAASAPNVLPVGSTAPRGKFTTTAGNARTVDGLRGQATLLWFVTTWCQGCRAGTRALASNLDALAANGVRVVELEMAGNLGRQGPALQAFGREFGGTSYTSRDWTWGQASKAMTAAYDPGGYGNVYYLLAGDGRITYVNASPAATMQALMTAAVDLHRGFNGPIGPEGVPDPAAPPLAGLANAATGAPVDGISCSRHEQLLFHIHAHLAIFVAGKPVGIPAGIGIAPPRAAQSSPYGPFVDSGSCFYWLHTHAEDGIIHIESPVKRGFTLGAFFDIWGQPLGPDRVGPAKGTVTAFVDGHAYHGNPRDIELGNHVQVQLDVGKPVVRAGLIRFPKGL